MASKRKVTQPEHTFWLWEIWLDRRELFKAIVGDVLFFLLLMGVLAGGRWFLHRLDLTPSQAALIEEYHYRSTVAVWLLLTGTLMVEVLSAVVSKVSSRLAAWKANRDEQHDR